MRHPEKNLNRYCAAFLFIKIGMRFLVLINIIFWLSTVGFSQDFTQTPLTWKINYLHDQISQESLSYTCSFKTNGLQDIMWIQKNGKFNTVLNVTDLTGSWSNFNSIGVVKYAISVGAESGSISFERTAEGIFAYLALSQGTAQPLNYKFSVSKITVD